MGGGGASGVADRPAAFIAFERREVFHSQQGWLLAVALCWGVGVGVAWLFLSCDWSIVLVGDGWSWLIPRARVVFVCLVRSIGSLEWLICLSPSVFFFAQARSLARSLRSGGGRPAYLAQTCAAARESEREREGRGDPLTMSKVDDDAPPW